MLHPGVLEAAVVAVPDDGCQERPLAVVVRRAEAATGPVELQALLEPRVAKWWIPERWAFVSDLPKTSVVKFDKKELRVRQQAGDLRIERLAPPDA